MQQERQARHGWSERERRQLFDAVEQAMRERMPLRRAFEWFAEQTGRKTNSVRNYYYTEQRRQNPDRGTSFTPFDEQELEMLLDAMAKGRAQGKSVRRIALELSDGDERGMLRFQNKYRSMVKKDPARIREREQQAAMTDDLAQTLQRQQKERGELLGRFMQNIVRSGKYGELLLNGLNGLMECCEGAPGETYAWKKLAALNHRFVQQEGIARISGMEEYVAALRKCLEALQAESAK